MTLTQYLISQLYLLIFSLYPSYLTFVPLHILPLYPSYRTMYHSHRTLVPFTSYPRTLHIVPSYPSWRTLVPFISYPRTLHTYPVPVPIPDIPSRAWLLNLAKFKGTDCRTEKQVTLLPQWFHHLRRVGIHSILWLPCVARLWWKSRGKST